MNKEKKKKKQDEVIHARKICAFSFFVLTQTQMASYLKKYVTALASAKDYVAQVAVDHVYAQEALIVPFPTLAIYDREKHIWFVHIKAWLYLPFEGKKIKSYLPTMPRIPSISNFFAAKPPETKNEQTPTDLPVNEEEIDDDIYQDCLGKMMSWANEYEF